MNEKRFDGRVNFAADDQTEARLEEHFEKYAITPNEIWKNFPIYARRVHLKRFLAHYELFRMIVDLPGDILELGVFRGTSLMSWANFLEIRCMGDRQRRVFGFDNFAGFTEIEEKDGAVSAQVDKVAGGFDPSGYEEMLRDAIQIYDADRFIPYKARVVLVKGDVEKTIPAFVAENTGRRWSPSSTFGPWSSRAGSYCSTNTGFPPGKARQRPSTSSLPTRRSSCIASTGRAIPAPT
jgi:hypothetical protein